MRNLGLLRLSSLGRFAVFLFALPILILTVADSAFAQTSAVPPVPIPPAATTQPPSAETLKGWSAGMARTPLPKEGCFTSSYPSTEWQEVPCTTAPERPYPPARGPRPGTVGNGNDVSAQVTGTIYTAVGSFESVTGVTSETGQVGGTGGQVANTFSLQLNTNFFSTSPTCNGAANPSNCRAWEQFVYSNAGFAFIQYWLINYNTTCPSGWNTFNISGGNDCWKNGVNSVSVPTQVIANLANLSLLGQAISGRFDTIIMATGGALWAAQNDDSILVLAQGWTAAEFNIVGDCCSSQANFNNGSTIVVRTSVDSGTPQAPSCLGQGFTGETNNLVFDSPPTAVRGTSPAIMFTQSSTGMAVSACTSATTVASGALTDTHDFNGDGYSDILWLNTSGAVGMWLMNGTTIVKNSGVNNVATVWSLVGQRDFNGDGKADLLWRDTSGDVGMWLLNGTAILQANGIAYVPTVWSIVGTGDFNGDGLGDVLWRDTSGNVGVWLMNGAQIYQNTGVGNASPSVWSIAGTGDFNGDGKTDILWIDTSGDVGIWFMNGTAIASAAGVARASSGWSVVGTGDFNGDGMSDILWRNTSGAIGVWLMNGTSVLSAQGIGSVASVWSVAVTGDFNGDGKSDILWHDTSGDVGVWFMNGTQILSATGIGNAPTAWSIQGAGAD